VLFYWSLAGFGAVIGGGVALALVLAVYRRLGILGDK
jgi:hypothetical protein